MNTTFPSPNELDRIVGECHQLAAQTARPADAKVGPRHLFLWMKLTHGVLNSVGRPAAPGVRARLDIESVRTIGEQWREAIQGLEGAAGADEGLLDAEVLLAVIRFAEDVYVERSLTATLEAQELREILRAAQSLADALGAATPGAAARLAQVQPDSPLGSPLNRRTELAEASFFARHAFAVQPADGDRKIESAGEGQSLDGRLDLAGGLGPEQDEFAPHVSLTRRLCQITAGAAAQAVLDLPAGRRPKSGRSERRLIRELRSVVLRSSGRTELEDNERLGVIHGMLPLLNLLGLTDPGCPDAGAQFVRERFNRTPPGLGGE